MQRDDLSVRVRPGEEILDEPKKLKRIRGPTRVYRYTFPSTLSRHYVMETMYP